MRFFERSHVYREDWETVTSAWWVKYPNPAASHVKEIHTVTRDLKSSDRFAMRRVFYLEYGMPAWMQKMFKITMEGWATEDVECSRTEKCLVAKGRNITFSSFFQFEEEIKYSQHPENPNWTLFNQRMQFRVLGFGILGHKLESAARDNAEMKSTHGISLMDSVIAKIKASEYGVLADQWKSGATQKAETASNDFMTKMSLYQTKENDFPSTSA
jgi:PRELI-like family